MDNDVYVGLDIGTTKVACIIATRGDGGGLEVVGVGKCNSIGLRKGVMRNMLNIVESIQTAVKEAELMAGVVCGRRVGRNRRRHHKSPKQHRIGGHDP